MAFAQDRTAARAAPERNPVEPPLTGAERTRGPICARGGSEFREPRQRVKGQGFPCREDVAVNPGADYVATLFQNDRSWLNAAVHSERLIVFVKAPRVGTVKTRLAEAIGESGACAAYRAITESLLKNIASLASLELRFTPDDAADEIRGWLGETRRVRAQGDGDLGMRLSRAFAEAFAEGCGQVAVIGSDCPDVRAEDIRTAWNELRSHDLVIGPATDGGYWLIGLRAPQARLFEEISWSSDRVLSETLRRAAALGLRVQLLRILTDVDTATEWNAYVQNR